MMTTNHHAIRRLRYYCEDKRDDNYITEILYQFFYYVILKLCAHKNIARQENNLFNCTKDSNSAHLIRRQFLGFIQQPMKMLNRYAQRGRIQTAGVQN